MECGRKEERPLEEDAEQERRGWRSMAKAADVAAAMRLQEAMACVCVGGGTLKKEDGPGRSTAACNSQVSTTRSAFWGSSTLCSELCVT